MICAVAAAVAVLIPGTAIAATLYLYDANGNQVAALDEQGVSWCRNATTATTVSDGAITASKLAPEVRVNPPGTLIAYAGQVAPPGYLLCNGQAVSRATYAALFAAIGTTYGAGDGSTTFNLPDLRSRVPLGFGQGVGLSNRTLAAKGGEESHTLTTAELPIHAHAADQAAHSHLTAIGSAATGDAPWGTGPITYGNVIAGVGRGWYYPVLTDPQHPTITVANAGGGAAHGTMPPSLW